jgi:hypothetical protein
MPKTELRKTRDFAAKINATFEFIRENFKPLATTLLYIGGPFFLIQGIFSGFYNREALFLNPLDGSGGIFSFYGDMFMWLGLMLISSIFGYAASVVVVFEYLKLYEQKAIGETITVSDVWEKFKETFAFVLLANIAVAIVVLVGFVFLVIPGIYVAIVLTLVTPIMIVERKSFGDAFSRSFSLISDKWWSTFGLLFIMGLIAGFMGIIFSIPQAVFTFFTAFHRAQDGFTGDAPMWQEAFVMVTSIFQTVGSSLLQAIVFIALGFQYFNLVERKEAKGLMTKLDQFGKNPEEAAPRADETY